MKIYGILSDARLALIIVALAVLCTWSQAQETTTDGWMNKAAAFSNNGSTEEAISAYNQVLMIDPKNVTAWRRKALELQISGKENESAMALETALGLIDEGLKEDPEDAKAWYLRSLTLESLGRHEDSISASENALRLYNRSLEQNPNDASSWRGKAEILYKTGKTDEGLQALDKALDIDPKNIDLLSRKGEFLEFIGRYNESLEVFDQVLELLPADDVAGRAEISGWPRSRHLISQAAEVRQQKLWTLSLIWTLRTWQPGA